MPGVLGWFLQLILFDRLQHSTVCLLFLLFLDLASPSISLVLQPEVKSRMRPSYCVPSCDVTKLADRASRVRRRLGSNTCLFLAKQREFQIFKKQSIFFVSRDLNYSNSRKTKFRFIGTLSKLKNYVIAKS